MLFCFTSEQTTQRLAATNVSEVHYQDMVGREAGIIPSFRCRCSQRKRYIRAGLEVLPGEAG